MKGKGKRAAVPDCHHGKAGLCSAHISPGNLGPHRGNLTSVAVSESVNSIAKEHCTHLSRLTESARHRSASLTQHSISSGHPHSPSRHCSAADAPERSTPTKLSPAPLSRARLALSTWTSKSGVSKLHPFRLTHYLGKHRACHA